MRRGREFYSGQYEKAIELHSNGISVKDIARELGVSYSTAYHWIKGIRKPDKGNVRDFVSHIEKSGPLPAVKIKDKFPKHNELFLIAEKRGIAIKRHIMSRGFGEYRTWYYLPGQEELLKKRLDELFTLIKRVKSRFI